MSYSQEWTCPYTVNPHAIEGVPGVSHSLTP